jgi:hypothetical protein
MAILANEPDPVLFIQGEDCDGPNMRYDIQRDNLVIWGANLVATDIKCFTLIS